MAKSPKWDLPKLFIGLDWCHLWYLEKDNVIKVREASRQSYFQDELRAPNELPRGLAMKATCFKPFALAGYGQTTAVAPQPSGWTGRGGPSWPNLDVQSIKKTNGVPQRPARHRPAALNLL